MKYRRIFLLVLLALLSVPFIKAGATEVSNQADSCTDVLLVFARGSGDNNDEKYLNQPFSKLFGDKEKVPGAFFQKFQQLLDQNYPHTTYKAQSIHNFPGKYNQRGYPAPGIFGPTTFFNNGINADVAWWPWGDYQDSIKDGQEEIIGYIKDEISRCPDQEVVLGGYSQGAEIVGNSLFKLTENERKNIAGVALFGDPKYIGAETSWKPWEDPKPYPWKRGTAGGRKRGIAEARQPYAPDDMKYKTLSWCFDDDPICTDASSLIKKLANGVVGWDWSKSYLGSGHTRYITYGAPQAAEEIFQRMAPDLYALEKFRGGVNKEVAVDAQSAPLQPNNQPIDIMFLVDVSAGMDDVLGTLRAQTDSILPVMKAFFPNVRYGLADISEQSYGNTIYYPRYNFYQDPVIYQPPSGYIYSSTLNNSFYRKLSWSGSSGGGVDRADPLGLAVEKTAMRASWDPNAVKHIILITDRPAKDPYTYNICDSIMTSNIGIPPLTCTTTPSLTSLVTNQHPELCDTAWQIITGDECALGMSSPGSVHNITRRLNDSITVAQSQHVGVTVVVPHPLSGPNNPSDTIDTDKQLEYFAKATAGLYLKYNAFDRVAYSDMLWRVLNHQPKQIALAYKDALEILGPNQVLGVSDQIKARTNVPITLDVSESPITADEYKWDFNGDGTWDKETESPNIEHTFTVPTTDNFVQVAAYAGEEEQARTTLPLTVEQYDGPLPDYTSPELPTNLQAKVTANGEIEVTWDPDGEIFVVIKDPETGLPIVSVPGSNGSITIPNSYFSGGALLALAVTEDASSEPQTLEVEQLPIEVVNQEDLEFVKFNGLSPGETVAGNEILNTNTAEVVQAASTTAIQTPGLATTPNVLAENVVSGSQVLSRTASPALASDSVAATQPIPSNSEASQQPPYLLIVLVVGGGVVAVILAIAKKTDN